MYLGFRVHYLASLSRPGLSYWSEVSEKKWHVLVVLPWLFWCSCDAIHRDMGRHPIHGMTSPSNTPGLEEDLLADEVLPPPGVYSPHTVSDVCHYGRVVLGQDCLKPAVDGVRFKS